MNYASIKTHDVANGPGVRVSLFVSGCTHHCPGCFNSIAWDFDYGDAYTADTESYIMQALKPDYIKGLSLLGGEPFEPQNQRELVKLLRSFRRRYPHKTVWCYSGYTYEQLTGDGHPHTDVIDEMLGMIDVLVDGRFVEEKKDLSLRFRGSSNQRIIDLEATRAAGSIVPWDETN